MNESPFIFSQYVVDADENAKQILRAKSLTLRGGAQIIAMVVKDPEVNASAHQTAKDQFLIRLNDGLLRGCFELFNTTARQFYRRNSTHFDVTEELFVRTVCGSASEMIFWHEFAHIVRGHIGYLRGQGLLPAFDITESGSNSASDVAAISDSFSTWQFIELDADIYGAQFLMARLVAILAAKRNRIAPSTLLRAFALGTRGMYEVLYQNGYVIHDDAPEATHPHPLSRAYVAFTHGLAGASRLGISERVANEWYKASQAALFEYELVDLGFAVDGIVLEAFTASRLRKWHETESVLVPYQLLQASKQTVWWRNLW
ncbi:hypothetical protein SAMN04515617_1235 [Collimonas sp. OK242]|uniref:hypothetical protein n=1 Tax=Collimonas sp. OK242 TaxID=1798195 RepID=UPI000894D4BA|nr:hypothetical protein [Collimonas sp. OK242]SDY80834.1 hypothetical protein SAMN04515617_1235 [Collimonas sp. OK242]